MKNWDYKGVYCSRELPLHRELRAWCDLVDLTAKRWWKNGRDVPWWYNERANLSQFAAAITKAGGISFEEFSATKRKLGITTGRFKGDYSGRVDLHFETKCRREFNAEVKAVWSGAKSVNSDPIPSIEKALGLACSDIRKFAPQGTSRIGIVFVRPYIKGVKGSEIPELVEAWLKKVWEIEASAMAWVFPKNCALGFSKSTSCPGVVVLVRPVRH
jgi:hypothetical protein